MSVHILLIEDEEKIARFTELELIHEGYEVTKAADGREGLALAESGRFDLCLLDIMLPGLSGLEVLRRLRKSSQMPVIMLTARDAVMDKVSGLDMGADDYITKPFAIEELLARIRVALKKIRGNRDTKEFPASLRRQPAAFLGRAAPGSRASYGDLRRAECGTDQTGVCAAADTAGKQIRGSEPRHPAGSGMGL